MGIIAIEGIRQKAPVGYSLEERKQGSDIQIDIYLNSNISLDYSELDKGLDYGLLHSIALRSLNEEAKLLEEVVNRIQIGIKVLLDAKGQSNSFKKVTIRVSKWNPPLKTKTERTFIEESFDI